MAAKEQEMVKVTIPHALMVGGNAYFEGEVEVPKPQAEKIEAYLADEADEERAKRSGEEPPKGRAKKPTPAGGVPLSKDKPDGGDDDK